MGGNMARRLVLDCGYRCGGVYDVEPKLAEALAMELADVPNTHGTVPVAGSLADVTAASDVIITVVSNDAAMERIYFGDGDNLLIDAAGKTFLNCATVSPEIHQRVELAAEQAGGHSLEAPMASSIPQARAGTLFLMVAGKQEVFEALRPLLENISSALHFTGPAGTAAQVKALVNMVMNINTAALAEGLGLANALELDLEMVKGIFAQTGANSRVLETDGDDMIARDHECYFAAEHAAKDSGIALDLAEKADLPLPLAAATKAQYDLLTRSGKGGLDKSAVAELTFPKRRNETLRE